MCPVRHRQEIISTIEAVSHNNISRNHSHITEAKAQEVTTITGLTPYTNYTIQITVCPDECITKLNATSTVETGVGLPDSVTDAGVIQENMNAGYCTVKWSWSDRIPKSSTTFEIITESTLVQLSPNIEQQTYSNVQSYAGGTLEYFQVQIETKPNRNYNFYIKTKTCAGSSNTSRADGECVTDMAAPESVPEPTLMNSTENSPVQPIKVNVPNESNGTISCIFVLVKSGSKLTNNAITIDDINQASNVAINQAPGDMDYLAIAIQRSEINGSSIELILGEDTFSSCDISSSPGNRGKRATTQHISGRNLRLKGAVTYSYYVVSSTPSITSGNTYLKQSPPSSFYHDYIEDSSLWWIAGIIGGLAALVTVVLIVIYIKRRNHIKKLNDRDSKRYRLPASRNEMDETTVYANFGADIEEKDESKTSISVKELLAVFEQKNANGGEKFLEEFTALKREAITIFSTDIASNENLKTKNRYKNILPFDLSRVNLKGENEETYINACYIHGYSKSRKFIATQGPLPTTIDDFWRMVVEQKSKVIVMLTKCVEAQKKKCEKYWPDVGQEQIFGQIRVSCDKEEVFGGYKKRTFTIYTEDEPAYQVEQYHFLNWPDHGVPVTTSNFYRFYEACMGSHGNEDCPIIVHCSAGAGRTGAFIGYDCLIEEAARTNRVDIYQCVIKMRQQRVDMVQTCDQYKLLHKFLSENHLFKDSDADDIELGVKIQEDKGYVQRTSRIKEEFKNVDVASGISKISEKHAENYKVIIMWQQGDGNVIPKLNANHIETYDESIRLIACEGPKLANVENFWRAVLDSEVTTIVMLNELVKQNVHNIQYWPSEKGKSTTFGKVSVQLKNSSSTEEYLKRNFLVTRGDERKEVTQYHILGWRSSACPDDATTVLDVIDEIQMNALKQDVSTVLVHCRDGLGRTGAFCSIMNLISRAKIEGKADVFRVVKDLRDCRPGMIQSLDEYRFCYRAVEQWLCSNNVNRKEFVEENPYENDVQLQYGGAIYENHQISV
ncbi:receptor-type tyrosine-protein phosphatase epsilon-like [Styela clava]